MLRTKSGTPAGLTKIKAVKQALTSSEPVLLLLLFALLLGIILISFVIGRYFVPVSDIFRIFYAKIAGIPSNCPEMIESVVIKVRLPRIITAVLVGGALAISGTAYQGLFKNPMVSPDILGASAGAGFGAAMGILLSLGILGIQGSAFLFGLIAVVLSYSISSAVSRGKDAILILVLTGMVVSTLFSSFITLIKYVADPYNKLREITYWLMGGLSAACLNDVKIIILPLVIGVIPLFLLRWQLNVMVFGDEEARAMGVNTKRIRLAVILSSTLLTAAAVAVCGIIGWVGLVIPHLSRILVGPNYKTLLPASFLIGGAFLLLVDNLARSLFTMELPLGVLTSIIGAPFFIYLLMKRKKGWT
ncbi:MAG: iron ABC transporter permease [Clostridia bacterium]|jgi:iron complex transport system permease protein|nr:iron ABC transporter permease [Clostridia bacterium]